MYGNKLQDHKDFVCRCPRCHHGSLCQYRTAQFGYSLESLLTSNDYKDKEENKLDDAGKTIENRDCLSNFTKKSLIFDFVTLNFRLKDSKK